MDREKFLLRPLEHLYELSRPPLNMPMLAGDWQCMNVVVNDHRVQTRPGYVSFRSLGDNVKIQYIAPYIRGDETKNVLFLSETDLCKVETASGKTFSYKTETQTYLTTKQVDSIDAATKLIVTFEGAATLVTDGISAGDKFILDEDQSSDVEPDADWREIASVDSETQLTLTAAYKKAVTSPGNKDAKIRKVYSMPTRERWQYAAVDDKFCFTNGNVDVQYWGGTNYASALNSTSAKKARYCLSYAQRLLIADVEISSTREPWTVMWSKSGDPTDWTDSSAGSIDFLKTESKITGLGQVGNNVVVYKKDSFIIGYRTGDSTDPFTFPNERIGIGSVAPYGLISFLGTNGFVSKENIYILNGDQPEPIGDPIKYKFYSIIDKDELQHVWGVHLAPINHIIWFANTNEGHLAFAYDYQDKQWSTFQYYNHITGAGEA